MIHHREPDRQCPMLCDDPANTYLVALDIALDGERITASCPECGRTLNHTAGDATPTRFTGTNTGAGPQVMVHYLDGRSLRPVGFPLRRGASSSSQPHLNIRSATELGGEGPGVDVDKGSTPGPIFQVARAPRRSITGAKVGPTPQDERMDMMIRRESPER